MITSLEDVACSASVILNGVTETCMYMRVRARQGTKRGNVFVKNWPSSTKSLKSPYPRIWENVPVSEGERPLKNENTLALSY